MGKHSKPSKFQRQMSVAVPVLTCACLLLGSSGSSGQTQTAELLAKPVSVPTTSQTVTDSSAILWRMTANRHAAPTPTTAPVKPKPARKKTAMVRSAPTFTHKRTVTPTPAKSVSVTHDVTFNQRVLNAAKSQIGVPYVWGGTTPGVALDCSGLTQYAYEQAGKWIPRVTEDQFHFFRMIPKSAARPGDLVFFHTTSDPASYVYHVGVYLGGDDMMVVAPAPGNNVQIQNFDWGGNTITFGTLDIV